MELLIQGFNGLLLVFSLFPRMNWSPMRQAARCLFRPLPTSRLVVPGKRVGCGHKITMASVSTASNGANGKPNHWHGAGAAEFDMRSEFCLTYRYFAFY